MTQLVDETCAKSLRLLSLDGGGITAISQLIILKSIMLSVQQQQALPETPKPHEIFDLISGSGHGGLLALLLGRLHLSVDEAVFEYRQLAQRVFSRPKRRSGNGKYSAHEMEAAIKDIIGRNTPDQNPETTLLEAESDTEQEGSGEAARAVTAHPGMFKPLKVGVEEFVDGSLGTKNPCRLLLSEAGRLFDKRRSVGCVVSIGAGKPPPLQLSRPGLFQRLLPTKIVSVVESLSFEAEAVARDMEERFEASPDVYFRFNVGGRVADVDMADWERENEVESKTFDYLAAFEIETTVSRAAAALYGENREVATGKIMTVSDL
ncbi:FabD/lysophospholipase-like protein [Aspergillus saccharolyticus JOP 1030-1]|uniref:FabD/lysophospholipase-like protein n=1 Tax=Aspergillus saccharolyticus JOP 1030-1 TaxID=1450539 RepID=A0A319A9P3_9EURO|nr:FabD/lysophospholipase-like protein [Aspergillus saccharolyticus JOP 1030-1]PYH43722.1 FabD/lysophospholipase-like protein [Aspergillus saccharolyticus JOP 1030-1]